MNFPQPGDYIDIHVHDGRPATGVFLLESLMAHEGKLAAHVPGIAYTYGIHPWFLDESNYRKQIISVKNYAPNPVIVAIGEAGFDKIKGPSLDLQRKTFEEQVLIAEKLSKPVVIHCVRAWDELLSVHKKLRPKMPWLIHGFRGSPELAIQLLSKGMYLSFWFDFILRPESARLIKGIPKDRLFLETDGAEVSIREIYEKVSADLNLSVNELKSIIYSNYNNFFNLKTLTTDQQVVI